MFLDSNKKLVAVLTTAKTTLNLPVTVDYVDLTTTTTTPAPTQTYTNGVTPVDILSAPAASTIRKVNGLSIYGRDTAAKIVRIYTIDATPTTGLITAGAFVAGNDYQIVSVGTTDFTLIGASANTVGVIFTATGVGTGTGTASTAYQHVDLTLQIDDTLCYTDVNGWYTIDVNGNIKQTLSGGIASQLTTSGWASPAGPIGSTAPVQYYNRTSIAVTAAGATQGTATLLSAERNRITTSAAGTGVILFAPVLSGLDIWVDNDTVNAVNLYPQVGGQIDALGVNIPMVIPPGGSVLLSSASSTVWDSYLSNDPAFRNITADGITTGGTGAGITVNNANTTTAQNTLIAGTNTANLSVVRGASVTATLTGGATTTQFMGINSLCMFTPSAAGGTEYGIINSVTHNNANIPSSIQAHYSSYTLGSASLGGTISQAISVLANTPTINASATTNITTHTSFYAATVSNGAAQTITNVYSLRSSQTAGTGRWNLYCDGTAINYINGALLIGTTVDDTVNKLQVTGSIKATTGITSIGPTSGIGYGAGAGGTVTQITSRTTGVTLNKVSGAITLVSAAGSATWQTFTVTNSAVAATDTVIVNQKSGTDLNMIHVTAVAAGSFNISFATTGGTTTEQPVFNFNVIKGVAA